MNCYQIHGCDRLRPRADPGRLQVGGDDGGRIPAR